MINIFKKSEKNHNKSLLFLWNTIFWQKKINSVLKEFANLEIIKDTKLNELDFSKLNDKSKWENIDDLISDFITCLPFTDTASQQDKTMMINFIKFMFYQLSYKSFTKKVNLIFLKKSPYTIENKIAVNKSKRSFYYDFLDSFKYKPNYNITLIKLLKILL